MKSELKRKQNQSQQRARRVRAKLSANSDRPRLSIFRSNKYFYAQIINDETAATVASANSKEAGSIEAVGKAIAAAANKAGISEVVFDRGRFTYTGKVKVFADSAREAGLNF